LRAARLDGADFTGAFATDATFVDAILGSATQNDLAAALFSCNTTLPDGEVAEPAC
jgi:uncharacterized protein YjbI with pentapeptide repeats